MGACDSHERLALPLRAGLLGCQGKLRKAAKELEAGREQLFKTRRRIEQLRSDLSCEQIIMRQKVSAARQRVADSQEDVQDTAEDVAQLEDAGFPTAADGGPESPAGKDSGSTSSKAGGSELGGGKPQKGGWVAGIQELFLTGHREQLLAEMDAAHEDLQEDLWRLQ